MTASMGAYKLSTVSSMSAGSVPTVVALEQMAVELRQVLGRLGIIVPGERGGREILERTKAQDACGRCRQRRRSTPLR